MNVDGTKKIIFEILWFEIFRKCIRFRFVIFENFYLSKTKGINNSDVLVYRSIANLILNIVHYNCSRTAWQNKTAEKKKKIMLIRGLNKNLYFV